jgi:hypothetical protein
MGNAADVSESVMSPGGVRICGGGENFVGWEWPRGRVCDVAVGMRLGH